MNNLMLSAVAVLIVGLFWGYRLIGRTLRLFTR